MFFEPAFRDDEVNQGTLGSDFGSEVRVEQFGDQEQLEVDVVVNGVSTHLQNVVLAFLLDGSRQKGVQSGVQLLLDTLDEHEFTHLNSVHQVIQPSVLIRVDHNEILTQTSSDPNRSLQLGVNDQRPSGATADNGSVLNRHGIGRQSFVAPLGLL